MTWGLGWLRRSTNESDSSSLSLSVGNAECVDNPLQVVTEPASLTSLSKTRSGTRNGRGQAQSTSPLSTPLNESSELETKQETAVVTVRKPKGHQTRDSVRWAIPSASISSSVYTASDRIVTGNPSRPETNPESPRDDRRSVRQEGNTSDPAQAFLSNVANTGKKGAHLVSKGVSIGVEKSADAIASVALNVAENLGLTGLNDDSTDEDWEDSSDDKYADSDDSVNIMSDAETRMIDRGANARDSRPKRVSGGETAVKRPRQSSSRGQVKCVFDVIFVI